MHACQHNVSHISCSRARPSVFSPAVVCPKPSAPGLTATYSKLSDLSLTASRSKPPEFSFAAIASSPSLATAARTKSASFSLSAISANLPSLAAACSKTPKSSLNAVRSKHSVAAFASWSPRCPCYETNISVHVPQTLALDPASVTAAPANVTITTVVFAIHASNSQTLAALVFVNHRRIAQPA